MQLDDLRLERDGSAYRGSRAIRLSAAETTLLKTLMRAPHHVFTRAELRRKLLQREDNYDEFLAFLIRRLRHKLGRPQLIHASGDGKFVTLSLPGTRSQLARKTSP